MDTQAVSRKMSQLKLRTSSYRFSLLLCSQFALIVIAPCPRATAWSGSPGRRLQDTRGPRDLREDSGPGPESVELTC